MIKEKVIIQIDNSVVREWNCQNNWNCEGIEWNVHAFGWQSLDLMFGNRHIFGIDM